MSADAPNTVARERLISAAMQIANTLATTGKVPAALLAEYRAADADLLAPGHAARQLRRRSSVDEALVDREG